MSGTWVPGGLTYSLVSHSLSGASYLFFLQVFSRFITFTLNQLLIRFTDPRTLGIVSIQFELLLATILFLSREGICCALLRSPSEEQPTNPNENGPGNKSHPETTTPLPSRVPAKSKSPSAVAPAPPLTRFTTDQATVNLAWVPVLLGLSLTTLVCGTYLGLTSTRAEEIPHFKTAVYIYSVAACVELLAEPLFVVTQLNLLYRVRVSIKGLALVLRCFTAFGMTLYGSTLSAPHESNVYGVVAYAVAQLTYALVVLLGFTSFYAALSPAGQQWCERWHLACLPRCAAWIGGLGNDTMHTMPAFRAYFPRPLPRRQVVQGSLLGQYFSPTTVTLAVTFTKQSLLKHVLTEGDKMLITWVTTDAVQGVYAFVGNYGSLIARILFLPLEETSRIMFSRVMGSQRGSDLNQAADRSFPRTVVTSIEYLLSLLRVHSILGLLFICLGTNYTGLVVHLLGGERWTHTSAASTLAVYCVYIPILAYNGLTEAFVQSVASEAQLNALSRAMVFFSLAFVSTAFCLLVVVPLGAVGIVVANMVNMTMRITYSVRFINTFCLQHVQRSNSPTDDTESVEVSQLQLWKLLPSSPTLMAFGVSWLLTWWSSYAVGWSTFYHQLLHVALGSLCLLGTGYCTYRFDVAAFRSVIRMAQKSKTV
ncbi:Oligosaccharide translocation protein rft1 [Dispira simplex]|nr:Oligosaccharide translocation protein rft1 [Dispira simplex]